LNIPYFTKLFIGNNLIITLLSINLFL